MSAGISSSSLCRAILREQAKKSLKIIAQQSKMDEDAVEFLHKDPDACVQACYFSPSD